MKMPNMNINKSWKGLPSDYKVFIIVATIFFFLSPGMVVDIDEPSDLVRLVSSGGKIETDEFPMEFLSLLQVMWNKLTLDTTNNKDIKNLTGMRPVLVHSAVAGLIATFLLKV
tara:strand:+ start:90 stop:428 length:339 start_codon:yes stop_codon:yes gene_type:complete